MKRVIFHDNITEIGEAAFCASGIEGEVVIPKKVTKIERSTFDCCPKLKQVVFHDNITEIGKGAFGYSGIEGEVVIPLLNSFAESFLISLRLGREMEDTELALWIRDWTGGVFKASLYGELLLAV